MKKILLILFFKFFLSFGQTKGEINLEKNVKLQWEIQNFDKRNHTFKYCLEENYKYLCKIDNQEWFGSDNGLEFPKNQLKKLNLRIGSQSYDLETSKMFNPNFSGYLGDHQFKLVTYDNFKILYSFYSDGAGAYTAHWKIENGKVERIVFSRDEEFFEWQSK
jgi:hypothetical protein